MAAERKNILVTCAVRHIAGVPELLENAGNVTYLDDPDPHEATAAARDAHAIFCQPNRTKVFVGRELIDAARRLEVICTASTGTHHIDMSYAAQRGIPVLDVYHDPCIYKVSSTAELNFGLLLAAVRRIPQSIESVKRGEWDCNAFIGQQLNQLAIGIVGYERLGRWYAKYCRAFGCRVLAYDHVTPVTGDDVIAVDRDRLLAEADVLSFHVYWPADKTPRVDASWFARMKPTVIIVNTARGDVVSEADLLKFLDRNPRAMYATDVLENEVFEKGENPVVAYARTHDNVIITPHLGGQTRYGQEVIYRRSAEMLKEFFQRAH